MNRSSSAVQLSQPVSPNVYEPANPRTVSTHNRYSVALIGARTVVGIALLAQPHGVLAPFSGRSSDRNVGIYARILGARHLLEAAILWRWTTPVVVRAGAAVDAIHAASAFALVKTRHHRRLASLNVASASTLAILDAALARRIK